MKIILGNGPDNMMEGTLATYVDSVAFLAIDLGASDEDIVGMLRTVVEAIDAPGTTITWRGSGDKDICVLVPAPPINTEYRE